MICGNERGMGTGGSLGTRAHEEAAETVGPASAIGDSYGTGATAKEADISTRGRTSGDAN
eukprot:scaffold113055_cov34-Tisochrysis_lutea.AAC.2